MKVLPKARKTNERRPTIPSHAFLNRCIRTREVYQGAGTATATATGRRSKQKGATLSDRASSLLQWGFAQFAVVTTRMRYSEASYPVIVTS